MCPLILVLQYNDILITITKTARAQQLLRWATMPEQSGPKSGGGANYDDDGDTQ